MTLRGPSTAPRRAPSDLWLWLMPALGLFLIFSGLSQVVGPRAHFKGSSPPPGARLPDPPQAVTVWFDQPIDPGSQLFVAYVRPADARAGQPRRVLATALGPDPANPVRSSLVVMLPHPALPGSYVVRWETRSHGGPQVYGALVFGVTRDTLQLVDGRVVERVHTSRHGGWRAVYGGAFWIVLSPLVWWLSRRSRNAKAEDEPPPQPNPPGTWGEPPDT
jgi:methionine-rich copper-binding protein CopC